MSANTSIEWAHHTFNPLHRGRVFLAPTPRGRDRLQMRSLMAILADRDAVLDNEPKVCVRGKRLDVMGLKIAAAGVAALSASEAVPSEHRPRIPASDAYWREPLAWAKAAKKAGERHRVFCASTADVFEAREDLDEHRIRLFNLIDDTPELDWLLLTKRPEHALRWWTETTTTASPEMSAATFKAYWPPNAWIGTSVENQEQADKRVPELLKIPARVRFISAEPLLGPVDLARIPMPAWAGKCPENWRMDALRGWYGPLDDPGAWAGPTTAKIAWVIAGGESGRGRGVRPMHPAWARGLRDQCAAAGVPFLFKQWGEWAPICALDIDNKTVDAMLYRSNRIADPERGEDQGDIDESYGRTCRVPELVLRAPGQHVGLFDPAAFTRDPDGGFSSMHAFRIGKHASGRILDGVTHDGFPS